VLDEKLLSSSSDEEELELLLTNNPQWLTSKLQSKTSQVVQHF